MRAFERRLPHGKFCKLLRATEASLGVPLCHIAVSQVSPSSKVVRHRELDETEPLFTQWRPNLISQDAMTITGSRILCTLTLFTDNSTYLQPDMLQVLHLMICQAK